MSHTAVTSLIYTIRLKLQAYQESRKPVSRMGKALRYVIVAMTGFLALPLFPTLLRDPKLTNHKLNDVIEAQQDLHDLENSYLQAPNPEHSMFVAGIKNILIKLDDKNNRLHLDYKKSHFSERQITDINQQRKKTWFQSGLTNTLDACFLILKEFRAPISTSTVNIHSSLGTSPNQPVSATLSVAPPQYSLTTPAQERPPALNPFRTGEPDHVIQHNKMTL